MIPFFEKLPVIILMLTTASVHADGWLDLAKKNKVDLSGTNKVVQVKKVEKIKTFLLPYYWNTANEFGVFICQSENGRVIQISHKNFHFYIDSSSRQILPPHKQDKKLTAKAVLNWLYRKQQDSISKSEAISIAKSIIENKDKGKKAELFGEVQHDEDGIGWDLNFIQKGKTLESEINIVLDGTGKLMNMYRSESCHLLWRQKHPSTNDIGCLQRDTSTTSAYNSPSPEPH
jgi:hypothetical protein